jgi:hypothetical protein
MGTENGEGKTESKGMFHLPSVLTDGIKICQQ